MFSRNNSMVIVLMLSSGYKLGFYFMLLASGTVNVHLKMSPWLVQFNTSVVERVGTPCWLNLAGYVTN